MHPGLDGVIPEDPAQSCRFFIYMCVWRKRNEGVYDLMNIPLMDIQRQNRQLKKRLHEAVQRVLESGTFISGEENRLLEAKMKRYTGAKHAIGVNSGTDALILSLRACGIGRGDEVITTPYTFYATVEAILQVGALPVFVDIHDRTYNIDVEQLQLALSEKTKAVIPVHLFGLPANLQEIRAFADRHNLVVIQDACQAAGAAYHGQPIEAWGDLICLSFYPTKNLGACGDGGMILTNNDEYANRLRRLQTHGTYKKYHHAEVGYNSRLDELQAAILSVKIDYLPQWNQQRQKNAKQYNHAFKDLPIGLPVMPDDRDHVCHLYVLKTEKAPELMNYLQEHGVGSGIYYPLPLHRQIALKNKYKSLDLARAESAAGKTVAIPVYPELTEDEKAFVIEKVKTFFTQEGRR